MPNLHDEINNENITGVRLLLEQGISGSFSRYGISSLTVAIGRGGDREIIDLLIQHGADVNKLDRSGKTPTHCLTEFVTIGGLWRQLELAIQRPYPVNLRHRAE